MADLPSVEVATFSSASPELQAMGLLGWLSVVVDGTLELDGLTLRRTRAGRLALSFPVRVDATGTRHPYIWPVDAAARLTIERQVLDALDNRWEIAQ